MSDVIKFGRIQYIEPNEIFGGDNQAVNQEDLSKYVNLSVKIPSRYYNENNWARSYDTILQGECFEKDESYTKFYLTDNYVNVSYNEYRTGGKISAGELFGIDSIDISFDVQFFPQVTINFTDVKGFGLMSTMEHIYKEGEKKDLTAKSFFTSLFNFPYPIFTLEVKGYYGKSVSFDLSLLEFNTSFDSQSGNFKTTVKFIGHMYGVYADTPISYLMISPYIDYNGDLKQAAPNEDPVGKTWENINVPEIPTYLSLLRGFNDFLSNINNDNGEGFSIVDTFISNSGRIEVLNQILDKFESIKKICNGSRVYLEADNNLPDNVIAFILKKDSDTIPDLKEKNITYKNLMDIIGNDAKYISYKPVVSATTTNTNYIWIFTNLNELIEECKREIEILKASNDDNRGSVNKSLLDIVQSKMGIIPNIKNVYKMLFKHLNCFSEHFYNTLDNIDSTRTLNDCGLFEYETDIPLNSTNPENTKVPPFPAVYETSAGGEKTIKYPGEVDLFSNKPEVELTERIFDSINYFGQSAAEQISEFNKRKEEATEEIYTRSGLFFMDGLNMLNGVQLNENLKHYSIVRPSNGSFNSYIYTNESVSNERYNDNGTIKSDARNAKRSELIRDIFLSRLATFGRLHYSSDIANEAYTDGHIINVEASLLKNVYDSLGDDNNVIDALRNMTNDNLSAFTINRYNKLSGGTDTKGGLWGFINYQPGDELNVNNSSLTSYARNGKIHYNGYSGSTIIIYSSGTTFDSAENIYNSISYNDEYKIKSDAGYSEGHGTAYEMYGDNSYIFYSSNNFTPNNLKYCLTYNVKEGNGFGELGQNYGTTKDSVIGTTEEIWNFLFEKYQIKSCKNEEGWSDDNCEINSIESIATKAGLTAHISQYSSINKLPKPYDKNKICISDKCAILAIKESQKHIYYSSLIDLYGTTAIPVSVLSSAFTWGFENKFITVNSYSHCLDNLLNVVENNEYDKENKYIVFAKNIQYDRSNDSDRLTDEKVWSIWKKFVCKVLNLFGYECSITSETVKKEVDRTEANKQLKIDIYYTLKTLYDKWYSGLKRNGFDLTDDGCEFNKIHYLTTTFNNISESMIVDLESLVGQINNAILTTDESSQSVISFMAKTAQDNNCTFLALPMKLQWGASDEEIKSIFKPYNFYNGSAEHDPYGTSYVIMYNGDVSHNLAIDNSEFVNDGYDIANYMGEEISATQEAALLFVENEHSYIVPAFGVTYGMQNQNFFKNISVNTTNPTITDYSIANTLIISQNGSSAGASNSMVGVKSLYPIYANRSYTCSVEMLGSMYITPLLYFQLNNVPMFRGAYMITNVHHRITPNDFTTTFSGVRVSKYKIPINTDVISLTSLLRFRRNYLVDGGDVDINEGTSTPINDQYKDLVNLNKKDGVDNKCFFTYSSSHDCHRGAVLSVQCLLNVHGIADDNNGYSKAENSIRLVYEKDGVLCYFCLDGEDYKDKYNKVVDSIKEHLSNNRPVIVGVNHTFNGEKNEGTTDHWVVIYAYGEHNSKTYFRYFETGSDHATSSNREDIFWYEDGEKPKLYNNNAYPSGGTGNPRRYDVTVVKLWYNTSNLGYRLGDYHEGTSISSEPIS